MSSAPFGTIDPASAAARSGETEGVPATRPKIRSGRRAEDTGAGCRANAAADLARAQAPGGAYMRQRLEQSAAIWAERASMLERIEDKFNRRTIAA